MAQSDPPSYQQPHLSKFAQQGSSSQTQQIQQKQPIGDQNKIRKREQSIKRNSSIQKFDQLSQDRQASRNLENLKFQTKNQDKEQQQSKEKDQKSSAMKLIENRGLCWRLAILYSILATLLYAEQNALSPNLTAIKKDLNLSNKDGDLWLGGYINLAFFLFGVPSAILVGYLTPTMDRNQLMFYVMLLGQGPNAFALMIDNLPQLFIVRCMTGISVGGVFPLVFSILGDLFPSESRGLVSILVAVSLGAGTSVGQAIAGYVGALGDWRLPLALIAMPNILLAGYTVIACQDPPRGASEQQLQKYFSQNKGFQYKGELTREKTFKVITTPTNMLAIFQGIPGCLPWGVIISYMTDYLAVDQGIGLHLATTVSVLYGIGGVIGVIIGGVFGQYLYNKKQEYLTIFVGIGAIASIPPLYVLLDCDLQQLGVVNLYIVSLIGGICSCLSGVNLRSILLNVNVPEARALALALHATTDDVGKGLGPYINALMISSIGRKNSFNISLVGWVFCGISLFLCTFTIRKDEANMQKDLQKYIGQAQTQHQQQQGSSNSVRSQSQQVQTKAQV